MKQEKKSKNPIFQLQTTQFNFKPMLKVTDTRKTKTNDGNEAKSCECFELLNEVMLKN